MRTLPPDGTAADAADCAQQNAIRCIWEPAIRLKAPARFLRHQPPFPQFQRRPFFVADTPTRSGQARSYFAGIEVGHDEGLVTLTGANQAGSSFTLGLTGIQTKAIYHDIDKWTDSL